MHRKKKYLTHLPSVSNMGLHSLHTVRFYELWQNPFVTEVARTFRGESQFKHSILASNIMDMLLSFISIPNC